MKKHKGRPFTILGINSDALEEAKRVVKEKNLTWPNLWAGPKGTKGPIPRSWNVRGWPTTYLIDHEGVIRYKGHGGGAELDALIAESISAAEAARME